MLALTELHNRQSLFKYNKTWIPFVCVGNFESGSKKGKCLDPAVGVVILFSERMEKHHRDSGHVGTRIVWVRITDPVYNVFFVVVNLPHKHGAAPQTSDTIEELETLFLSKHVHKQK